MSRPPRQGSPSLRSSSPSLQPVRTASQSPSRHQHHSTTEISCHHQHSPLTQTVSTPPDYEGSALQHHSRVNDITAAAAAANKAKSISNLESCTNNYHSEEDSSSRGEAVTMKTVGGGGPSDHSCGQARERLENENNLRHTATAGALPTITSRVIGSNRMPGMLISL